jgi:outer membrane lipoprotein carrier protein
MKRALAILLLGLVGAPPALADSGPERLDAFLAGTRSFQARFEQTVFDERMRRVEDGAGGVWLERPGRFRWHYELPYAQTIVGDGEQIWVHDADLEQVTVRPMADAMGASPAALLTSDRPVRETFRVEDLGLQGEIAWVELTPLDQDATFAKIRLGLESEVLRAMELVDNFGQTTQLRFAEVSQNRSLDPELFRFTPPPGADVIGQ